MVKLFIGNLSPSTTADQLRTLFAQYGKVTESDLVKDFGFVHMDEQAAQEAIRNLHHYELNGRLMNVEVSRSKKQQQQQQHPDLTPPLATTKLHVGNISSTCTSQELRAKFEAYGPVIECDIVKEYAFVHMERAEDAMEAIQGLDNAAFQGYGVGPESSGYRGGPGFGRGLQRGSGAGYSGAEGYRGVQTYSGEAGYSSGSPGYPAKRPSPYGERESYSGVDFYEQFRSRPLEERHSLAPPHLPPPPPPSSMMRDRLSASALNPYERRPMPLPPAPVSSSYYTRERSPVRRAPPVAEGYGYERSRLSPVSSSLSRNSLYEAPRARDPYAEQARYAF
ncbi:UNVERIFIED_CONTAM: hypothetical protein FKN15_009831 [Acipenser sinensis]